MVHQSCRTCALQRYTAFTKCPLHRRFPSVMARGTSHAVPRTLCCATSSIRPHLQWPGYCSSLLVLRLTTAPLLQSRRRVRRTLPPRFPSSSAPPTSIRLTDLGGT